MRISCRKALVASGIVLACAWPLVSGAEESGVRARIASVLDGDTVKVRFDDGREKTVRLLGVDAPESYKRRYGYVEYLGSEVSRAVTRALEGRPVVLTGGRGGEFEKDIHGRLLAYVRQGETDVCAWLLQTGYARVYRKSRCSRFDEFERYEAQAKKLGKGIWNAEGERSFYRSQFLREANRFLVLWFWEHDREHLRDLLCGKD